MTSPLPSETTAEQAIAAISAWVRGGARIGRLPILGASVCGWLANAIERGDWKAHLPAPVAVTGMVGNSTDGFVEITERPEPTWRCFHCDEVFTTVEAAREHFGPDQTYETVCTIDVVEYRRMEEVHRQHISETDEASKQFYAMQADHRQALIREEEKGYARGLADGRAAYAVRTAPAAGEAEPKSTGGSA